MHGYPLVQYGQVHTVHSSVRGEVGIIYKSAVIPRNDLEDIAIVIRTTINGMNRDRADKG